MQQKALHYTVGGCNTATKMHDSLVYYIGKGWLVKSITNVYSSASAAQNIVILEKPDENDEQDKHSEQESKLQL